MYRAEDIQGRLRAKPFQPLRIICSKGLRFEIYHPDLVMVGQRDIQIGFSTIDRPSVYDQLARVALVQIVALEDIPAKAGSSGGWNQQLGNGHEG